MASPAPVRWHQRVILLLAFTLERRCPDDLGIVLGPFAVRPDEFTELKPDVLVARRAELTEANLPVAPRLVVEVLSSDSLDDDFHRKKALYERLGTPSFWLIDPDVPELTVFELDERRGYRRAATVKGASAFEATEPFPVRIVPADLLGHRPT